ncbi:Platelet-activating factor acetylhydrolase IB subunit alpha2 [Pseudolycoriella hygida]|uniref:Platelet-activating factor acetylhydrolase IB subunit alpha2 n=1 Tax=Pseudolycoriella hygida TaxID=35572 RepID=A0A9Q0N3S3_9DIPT|nr:Platelet-activating factor acetylhydrolase IB subunit alpha2 [Pseudolycoriella hygida]
MKLVTLTILFLVKYHYVWSASQCGTLNQGEASRPSPRSDQWWHDRHAYFSAICDGNPDLPTIFFGDSITQGWNENGLSVFKKYYAPLGAVNFGIGGDRTQHVIWRIINGEVKRCRPKVVVLLIGTNNISTNYWDGTAAGVVNVVGTLRFLLPNTKIILLGILPRQGVPYFDRITKINNKLQTLHDGRHIFFLDMFEQFKGAAWGTVPSALFYDGLHLTTDGYQLWADTMQPLFNQLIDQ